MSDVVTTIDKDLIVILTDAGIAKGTGQYNELMMVLASYITRHGHKVFDHAYKKGKLSNGPTSTN